MLQETQDSIPITYTSDTLSNPGTTTITSQTMPYSVYEQPVSTTIQTTSIPLQETTATTITTVPNTTNTATAATTEVSSVPQTIYKIIPGVERKEKEKILALILFIAGFCCPILWCCGSCFMTKHYSGGTRILGGANLICCVLATVCYAAITIVVLAVSLGVGLGVGLQR